MGLPGIQNRNLYQNEKVKLNKIFFVSHGEFNSIKKLNYKEAFLKLLASTYFPAWSRKGTDFSIDFLKDIVKGTDFYNLKFVPEKSIIKVIKKID